MRLTLANAKAIRYAIMKWHYSKSVPSVSVGYNVFNDKDEWCGVICYGRGGNRNLAKMYGLKQGEVLELERVALNGKQEQTSRAIALSMKLIKKDAPLCKLLVSYADEAQGHKGIIYKATNWKFDGDSYSERVEDPVTKKLTHAKTIYTRYGRIKGLKRVKNLAKHRFIYWLVRTSMSAPKDVRS